MSQHDLPRVDALADAVPASRAVTAPGQGPDSTFRMMAELMPQLVWSTTADGYHDYFNARWYAFTGMPRPDEPGGEVEVAQGWNWKEFLHPDDHDRAQRVWAHSLATGEPYEIEYRFREFATGGYRWFLARALPVHDAAGAIARWFGTCTDIDDAKQNEAALGVLADAGAALDEATDEPTDEAAAMNALAAAAVPRLADWCAIDLVDAPPTPDRPWPVRRAAVAHVDPTRVALAHELAERYPPDHSDDRHGVPYVLRTGTSQLMREIPDALIVEHARDDEHRRLLRALGLTSAIVVPLLSTDVVDMGRAPRVLGAISLVSAEGRRRYTADDVARAEELARRAVLAIERARTLRALTDERARLAEQRHELATRNEELQQQAVELEMQAAQLHEQAAALETQAHDLQLANVALAEGEARFRSLFESMTQGVLYQDATGRIQDANPAAERVLGLTRAQLTGRAPIDRRLRTTDADGVELSAEQLPSQQALRTGAAQRGVRIAVHDPARDEVRWLRVDAMPETRPGETRPFRVYTLFSDVTEEVRAEHERQRLMDAEREARRQMTRVLEQAPVAISVMRGAAHHFELANASYRQLLSGRELLGRPAREALAEMDPVVFTLLDRVYATGEPFIGVEVPVRYDRENSGTLVDAYFNLVYQPLRDASGLVTGIVTVANEVTDQVAARRAAERARASAEEANLAKSQFLRTVSHELRTPLNAIAGYADLVAMGLRGPVSDEQRSDLERIKRASQHLLGLINDILSFAKLEAGQVELDFEDVRVPATLAEVDGLLAPQLSAKGLHYEAAPCDAGLVARADPERLRQILLNLLGNAVKFTPEGGRIAVECTAQGHEVAIRVRDTGIGIPPEALDRIFDPFVQVGRDLRAPSEGVGLGLSISRDLARRMGGDLTVVSRVGEGSTFTLLLPRAGAEEASSGQR